MEIADILISFFLFIFLHPYQLARQTFLKKQHAGNPRMCEVGRHLTYLRQIFKLY